MAFQKSKSNKMLKTVQEFCDSGDDTLVIECINKKVLTEEESNGIEGKITLFSNKKGSSSPGIDDFTVNWLRKF